MPAHPFSQLLHYWMNEPDFRQQMRSNMETAVRNQGLELNEDHWQGLRRIDWSLTEWVNFLYLVQLERQFTTGRS